VGDNPEKKFNSSIRSSTSAILPEDPVVACLERRSLDFQGFLPDSHIENLQTVKYEINDLFRPHYDWSSADINPRLSTIFGYIECDDCVGGSTQFPNIDWNFPPSWCKFVDCDSEDSRLSSGVGFKPIIGNAVFWVHHYTNGTGHPGTMHAGMPVRKGTKIGLNIMTRRDAGYS
jgi:prolyl 4-hydroxylase